MYWVAYRVVAGRLHKVYIGLARWVTRAALEAALAQLTIPDAEGDEAKTPEGGIARDAML